MAAAYARDVFSDFVYEFSNGEAGALISGCRCLFQVAEVGRDAEMPRTPDFFLRW
jgi:hypothetical protein